MHTQEAHLWITRPYFYDFAPHEYLGGGCKCDTRGLVFFFSQENLLLHYVAMKKPRTIFSFSLHTPEGNCCLLADTLSGGNCCSTLSITVNSCYESEVFFYEVLSFQALKAFATTKLLLWLEIYWRHLFLVEVVVFVLSLKSLKMVVDKKRGGMHCYCFKEKRKSRL